MRESGFKMQKEAGITFQKVKSVFLKCILILCLLIIDLKASAPGSPVAYLVLSPPVDAYRNLINAIVLVESSGNPMAYNIVEDAYGAFQIRPIRLLDYYQRTGKLYSSEDCYNYEISKEIFLYYADKIGYDNHQTIARNWNGSGKMTLVYWEKVKKHL